MIRFVTYACCFAAFVWLGLESLHFRKSIRTSLSDAYAMMQRVDPDHSNDNGKVLNSYYENVYRDLPAIVVPACMLMAGCTVLLVTKRAAKPEQDAPANAG